MVEVDVINALRREGLGSRFQCLNHKKVLNVRKRKLIAQLGINQNHKRWNINVA